MISTDALEHHEEAEIAIAFGEEDLAGIDRPRMTPGAQRRQIPGAQGGERNVVIVGHADTPNATERGRVADSL